MAVSCVSSPLIVTLFKEADEKDVFSVRLSQCGFTVRCIPVLTTKLSVASVSEALCNDDLEFDAVVLTSQRACNALKEAVAKLTPTQQARLCVPYYVVGRRTADSLRDALPDLPEELILGSDTGSAEKLAPFILQHLPPKVISANLKCAPKVLFFCSDKRLDALPELLHVGGI